MWLNWTMRKSGIVLSSRGKPYLWRWMLGMPWKSRAWPFTMIWLWLGEYEINGRIFYCLIFPESFCGKSVVKEEARNSMEWSVGFAWIRWNGRLGCMMVFWGNDTWPMILKAILRKMVHVRNICIMCGGCIPWKKIVIWGISRVVRANSVILFRIKSSRNLTPCVLITSVSRWEWLIFPGTR